MSPQLPWFRRHLGDTIIVTGAIHCLSGTVTFSDPLQDLVRSGYAASLGLGVHPERGEGFWFVTTGLMLMNVGLLARSYLRQTGTLPASFSGSFFAIAVAIAFALPDSGIWTVLLQGIIALLLIRPVEAPKEKEADERYVFYV